MTSTTAAPDPGGADRPASARPGATPVDYVRKGLKGLASLRLTVVLFAFAIALVFFGTLAQMEFGIWTVVDQYFWSWVVLVPTDLLRQFGSVFLSEWVVKDGPRWTGAFPLPGGKLLGGLMLANLLAAHLVRFRLTWKRSGVILIHSGLILLFIGEFITREFAVEQRMSIRQGSSAGYSEDSRHMELAFVDSSDPKEDRVVVIDERRLRAGGRISHPDLPADVEVVDYFTNSRLEKAGGRKANPATAGQGTAFVAGSRPDVSGVDPNQKIDFPAAYVRLSDKTTGADLGTYLVSLELTLMGGHDDVTAGGKAYRMNLRNIRYHKPYSIYLEEFRFDRYPGTQKARNFSSEVVLTDPGAGVERRQLIKMNDPLRYAGETFYQSSFDPDEGGTILQVVKNPGWLIPYVSCVVVGGGMLIHFGIYLTQFLLRRAAV
ncbi:MAG TPA: cytochrome c biogenesis protein ResB [Urbifossiella sp.]|jgi:hypothetical protein|nr:cytochrome c biogenesis protein ResB [Urbifossiella sp.]